MNIDENAVAQAHPVPRARASVHLWRVATITHPPATYFMSMAMIVGPSGWAMATIGVVCKAVGA